MNIDDTLVLRFLKPLYNWWQDIGIYQLKLANYGVSVVLHGRSFGGGCLNCHSFAGNNPDTMSTGLRSATCIETVRARLPRAALVMGGEPAGGSVRENTVADRAPIVYK